MSTTEMAAGPPAYRTKRIILLLDGTWNDPAAGDNDTNIVRLEDLIVRTLRETSTETAATVGKLTHGYVTDGQENIVLYQRGVGTGEETGNWMRAFSEILVSPPVVEILRVAEGQQAS